MSAKLAEFELKMQPPVLPPLRLRNEDAISPLTPFFPIFGSPGSSIKIDSPVFPGEACDSHRPPVTPSVTEHLVTNEIAGQDTCYLTEVAGANWWHKRVRQQDSNPRDGLTFKGGRWGSK